MIKSLLTICLLCTSISAFASYHDKGWSTTCSDTNNWLLDTGAGAKSLRLDFVGRSALYAQDLAFSVHLDMNGSNIEGFKTLYSTIDDVVVKNIDNNIGLSVGGFVDFKITQTQSGLEVNTTSPDWAQGCFTTLTW